MSQTACPLSLDSLGIRAQAGGAGHRPANSRVAAWRRGAVYMELAKVRLCALVLVTTLVGYLLSGTPTDWARLAWTLLGTALAAFGANALNQCWEVGRDARMERTRRRPLPSGRLPPRRAWIFAGVLAVTGPALLLVFVNGLAAGLALLTLLIYVLLYTPLKVRTPLNTLVGAVVGGIPPMIGWAAGTGGLEVGAWLLGSILFLWQIPHFLALAWMYRDDYARGGFRMLPVLDATGRLTCYVILLYSLALVPLALTVALVNLAGPVYAAGSVVLGLGLLGLGIRLLRARTRRNARRVFLASVIYLPLLLALMIADRPVRPQSLAETQAKDGARFQSVAVGGALISAAEGDLLAAQWRAAQGGEFGRRGERP